MAKKPVEYWHSGSKKLWSGDFVTDCGQVIPRAQGRDKEWFDGTQPCPTCKDVRDGKRPAVKAA
jgi:hypothetical protein